MPLHATLYHRVAIRGWAAVSVAGDAAAGLAAMQTATQHLRLDPTWGFVGDLPGRSQDDLGLAVCAPLTQLLPRTGIAPGIAIGIGTSKGELGQVPGIPHLHAPGMLTPRIAAALGMGHFVPCQAAAACSTGLACVLGGADAVEHGRASHALVGASESSLTPLVLAGFASAGVLCGETLPGTTVAGPGPSAGFAPAVGAAALVLGPDGPWRLVAGVRLGDAGHETQFTDPQTLATALRALWDVAPHPDAIICHATGTKAGDAYERQGLDDGPWRDIPRWCAKPVIGHCLGASGVVELTLGLESRIASLWKLSLGFGGHLVAVAVQRSATLP